MRNFIENNIPTDFCTFCEEDMDKVIYRTENFTVWLALGPIVEGYCLIIPNKHYNCIGALPESLHLEFFKLKSIVRSILEETYGSCIFYEHGRAGVCSVQPGEQLCYHAHLHAVPLNKDLLQDFDKDLLSIKLEVSNDIFELYRKGGHYLFYEDTQKNEYIFYVSRPIPRQYLRVLAANSIGKIELSSWNDFPRIEILESGRQRLIPKFLEVDKYEFVKA